MNHFEFDLTPAKAYDLKLFLQLNQISEPEFVSKQADCFLSLSNHEKIQARLEARKGRLLLGSSSVFHTIKIFSILNQYATDQNLGKILIVYQYRPSHDRREYLSWVANAVKTGFNIGDDELAINNEDYSKRIFVSTNHKVDYFDLVSSVNPQYFIFCGMRKQGTPSADLSIIPSMVEHYTSVVFDDNFDGDIGLISYYAWASTMFNDSKGARTPYLEQMMQACLRDGNKINEQRLMKFIGIEKV
jgi:hypothetical protein